MAIKPFLKFWGFLLLFFPISFFGIAQTGVIPTGTDTSCPNGISLYQRLYGGNKSDIGEWLAADSDSGYVLSGHTTGFGSGLSDGMLTKVSKRGAVMWSRAIGGSGNDYLYGVKRTNDNGFIAVGYTRSYGNPAGDAWLVKTDATGTVQWSKKYGDGNASGDAGFDVVQLSDGGYAFCGVNQYAGGVSRSFVVRTDNSGNVLWSNQYDQPGSDEAWGLAEDGNFLMVVGFYRAPDLYDGYLMKLDKSNGLVQWKRSYDANPGRHMLMAKIRLTNAGYQVLSLEMDDFVGTNQQQCIWNIGTDGTVQNIRRMVIPGIHTIGYGWTPLPDGGFVVANGENNNGSDIIFTRVDANGSVSWSRKYVRSGRQWIRAMISSPEGGYAAVGISNSVGTTADSNDVFLIRIDDSGNSGSCSGVSTTEVSAVSASFNSSTISPGSPGVVTISNPVITAGVTTFTPFANTLCFYCQPKPTGTARPLNTGERTEERHLVSVYPNPVLNGTMNLRIDALYKDRAVINIIDLNGTLLYSMLPRAILPGQNLFRVDLPAHLRNTSHYILGIQFENYISSNKIFVIR